MASNNRSILLAIGATAVLALGVGFGVARMTFPPPAEKAAEAPAEEAETSPQGHVDMTAERIATANIQIMTTAPGALAAEIAVQGSVTPQPQGEAVLAARADGVITRINRRLGDNVRPGEAVATIESRDASTIAADRASATARAIAARQVLAREQRLFAAGITARQDLEAAQAATAQANAEVARTAAAASAARVSSDGRTIAVVSPIGGRVTAATAVLGSFVTAGAELFRVADAARVEVQAAIPAADSQRVAPGDRVSVETPDSAVAGTVRSITPGVNAESRAATVIVTLLGDTSRFRPGQAVRVQITPRASAIGSGRIVVPEEAVQSVGGRDVVFARTAKGFQALPVTVGARGGGRAEIESGLKAGQAIAGKGAFLLKAEIGKGEAEEE